MSVKEKPHYALSAATLAGWIDSQPERWWSVDGDSLLISLLDFPCPSDELAPALRKVGKTLLLQDRNPSSKAHGETVSADKLDDLSDTSNRRKQKTLCLSWIDSDEDWLLMEDEPLVAK